jgi:S-disulfanyl-L-cysteine oxidoreductase SoxD
MRLRAVGLIATGSAIAVALGVWWMARSSPPGILKPDDASVVAIGSKLYGIHCASCHGASLEGQAEDWRRRDADGFALAPPHDATGHSWHHPDRLLFDITKVGVEVAANLPDYKTRMPAFEGVLDDEEIVAVLSFIKAQWPDDIRRRHDFLNERDADARR